MTTSHTSETAGMPNRDCFVEHGGSGSENYEKLFVPAIGPLHRCGCGA